VSQKNSTVEPSVAYILKGFPRLSETFIANEIRLLEEMGTRLRLFSIKPGDAGRMHSMVSSIESPLEYLPKLTSLSGTSLLRWLGENGAVFRRSHARLLLRRPLRYLSTLIEAVRMSFRYRNEQTGAPRKVFIKEFLQAGDIADRIAGDASIRHLHGHFCHGATTVTWFVSRLTGLPFSFTAHAKDIYVEDLNPGDLLLRKLASARFVTTCTQANTDHLHDRFPGCRKVHTIYHGLDVEFFSPAEPGPGPADPLIISVGRFVEKKGFQYLVESCAKLRDQRRRFRCLIVGEHGDQYEAIRQRVDELGLQGHVELGGPITQQELRHLYRSAAIFALPCQILDSGDRDGIPNVMAEAMASGLPVVSTAISGIPELVDDGVEGLLVRQRDGDALAAALGRLLDDPELRRNMGGRARQRICRCFDSRKTTVELQSLFQQHMHSGQAA